MEEGEKEAEASPAVSVSVCPPSPEPEEELLEPYQYIFDAKQVKQLFSFGKIVGRGTYGIVRSVTHKLTETLLACKIVPKSTREHENFAFREEFAIMAKARHPAVLNVKGVIETSNYFFLFSEMCRGGELSSYLCGRAELTENELRHFMQQLLSAVSSFHHKNICHRDLKPQNILLDDTLPTPNLKIADFGLAVELKTPGEMMTSCTGTLTHMAPEIVCFNAEDAEKLQYSTKCDVWSCGVIMYTLICGELPFWGENETELSTAIKLGTYRMEDGVWNTVSDHCKSLLKSLLVLDPQRRISATAALQHCFFRADSTQRLGRVTAASFAEKTQARRRWKVAIAASRAMVLLREFGKDKVEPAPALHVALLPVPSKAEAIASSKSETAKGKAELTEALASAKTERNAVENLSTEPRISGTSSRCSARMRLISARQVAEHLAGQSSESTRCYACKKILNGNVWDVNACAVLEGVQEVRLSGVRQDGKCVKGVLNLAALLEADILKRLVADSSSADLLLSLLPIVCRYIKVTLLAGSEMLVFDTAAILATFSTLVVK